MKFNFPENFIWGTATAAHQVEGNNKHSDFWLLEKTEGSVFAEPSGIACDHWNKYKEDIEVKFLENAGERINMEEVNLDEHENSNEGVECVQQ